MIGGFFCHQVFVLLEMHGINALLHVILARYRYVFVLLVIFL